MATILRGGDAEAGVGQGAYIGELVSLRLIGGNRKSWGFLGLGLYLRSRGIELLIMGTAAFVGADRWRELC